MWIVYNDIVGMGCLPIAVCPYKYSAGVLAERLAHSVKVAYWPDDGKDGSEHSMCQVLASP